MTISILNMLGSTISTNTYNVNGKIEVNGLQLSSGMYLLPIETRNGKQLLKFIKE